MKILNLGCGTKTCSHPKVMNIDWSVYLRLKKNRISRVFVPLLVRGNRLKRFTSLPDNIVVHDFAKGIPFNSNSADVVYHSHLLEHLDKNRVEDFLLEVKRVLRPGGIQRIVVPDLEKACAAYMSHISTCEKNHSEVERHDAYIARLIEQSVRKEATGTCMQKPCRRFIENIVLGDARQRGETHQWMYDRISLCALLTSLGYKNPQLRRYDTSAIPDWNLYGLDLNDSGGEYKPESLYMEANK
jgi:SAM-dependent methyltransferase